MATTKQKMKAVIYDKRGRVLSIGENSYVTTHPLQAKHAERVGLPHKIFLHAEIASIVKCRDLSKAHKISVFRFNKEGETMNAKPCPVCMSAIYEAGIKIIEHI